MFYAAIFDGQEDVTFRPGQVLNRENLLAEILPGKEEWGRVIHLARTDGLILYSDLTTQKVLCSK
jgi:hypothetical protein